jgi:hypothetical protein
MIRHRSLVRLVSFGLLLFTQEQCAEPVSVHDTDIVFSELPGFVVSNPVSIESGISVGGLSASRAVAQKVAYVSLSPNSILDAAEAEIVNATRHGAVATVAIINGGFDPVPVEAEEGDTISVTPRSSGVLDKPLYVKVPAKKTPRVVRSSPPQGVTDVALSVVVEVIFTEPVKPQTVTKSSFKVLHNGQPVAGDVYIEAGSTVATFVPSQSLDPKNVYQIVVTPDVQDYDNDGLDRSFESTFTTVSADDVVPNADFAVRGRVIARGLHGSTPAANATISITDATTGYTMGSVQTDSLGNYKITAFPPSGTLQLYASAPGLEQSCGAAVQVEGGGKQFDIELVPAGSNLVQFPASRMVGRVRLLHGDYLSGAHVSFETPLGTPALTVTTDLGGMFTACNFPYHTYIRISVPGYPVDTKFEMWTWNGGGPGSDEIFEFWI